MSHLTSSQLLSMSNYISANNAIYTTPTNILLIRFKLNIIANSIEIFINENPIGANNK